MPSPSRVSQPRGFGRPSSIERGGAVLVTLLLAMPAWAKPKVEDPRVRAAQEAAALSQVAASKNESGDFKLCADLYLQAFRTDPAFLAYLFGAARCEHKAGDLEAAERDYRVFLQRVPADDAYAAKAQSHLQDVQNLRKQAAEFKPEAKPAAVTRPAVTEPVVFAPATPPSGPSRAGAWTAAAVGIVAVAVGGYGLSSGLSDRDQLQRELAHGSGLVMAMTPTEARDREGAAQVQMVWGSALLGAGLVATGVGLYRALKPVDGFHVRWNGAGISLAGRF